MSKSLCAALCIAAVIVGLGACTVIDMPPEQEVGVDTNGHFVQNLSYDFGSGEIRSYKIDGSFVIEIRSYDAGSGTVKQSGGYSGTYTFDTKTKALTSTFEKVFVSPDWITLNATLFPLLPKQRVEHISLFDHNIYDNYSGTLGNYSSKDSETLWDGSSSETTTSIVLASDLGSSTYTVARKAFDSSGTVITSILVSYKNEKTIAINHHNPSATTVLLPGQSFTVFFYNYVEKIFPYTGGSGDYSSTPSSMNTVSVDSSANYSTSSDGLTLFSPINGTNGFARTL